MQKLKNIVESPNTPQTRIVGENTSALRAVKNNPTSKFNELKGRLIP